MATVLHSLSLSLSLSQYSQTAGKMALTLSILLTTTLHSGWQQVYSLSVSLCLSLPCRTVYSLTARNMAGTQTVLLSTTCSHTFLCALSRSEFMSKSIHFGYGASIWGYLQLSRFWWPSPSFQGHRKTFASYILKICTQSKSLWGLLPSNFLISFHWDCSITD